MDFIRMCLVLALSIILMTQIVFSAPAYGSDEIELADYQPDFNEYLALIRERRDVDNPIETADIVSRMRRQVAGMGGRPRYRGHRNRHRARGRLHGRRLYNTRRISKARGRVVVW